MHVARLMTTPTFRSRLAGVFISIMLAFGAIDEASEQIPIPNLDEGCHVSSEYTGMAPSNSRRAWLHCDGSQHAVLILHPNNLVGFVKLHNGTDVLAYLRAFSDDRTKDLFLLDGMIEVSIREEDASGTAPPASVSRRVFDRHFRAIQVIDRGQVSCESPQALPCGKEFEVRRVVIFPDQKVYELTERVFSNGYYQELGRKLVLKNGNRVGLYHFGVE